MPSLFGYIFEYLVVGDLFDLIFFQVHHFPVTMAILWDKSLGLHIVTPFHSVPGGEVPN